MQLFDVTLGSYLNQHSLCIFRPTCGNALALEHNGDLYACDHYVEPEYLLGNIKDIHMVELVASEQQRQFGQHKQDSLPQYCRDCEVLHQCNGGCPRNRFINTPTGEPNLNYLCAGYKLFFNHVDRPMKIMANLLRQNRAPAELMNLYATEDAERKQLYSNVGRNSSRQKIKIGEINDPCPCGSGKVEKSSNSATARKDELESALASVGSATACLDK